MPSSELTRTDQDEDDNLANRLLLLSKDLLELLLSFLLTPAFLDAVLSGTDSRLKLKGVRISNIFFPMEEKHNMSHLFGFGIKPNPSIIWHNGKFYSDMAVISVNGQNVTITVRNGWIGKHNPNPDYSISLYSKFSRFLERTFWPPHHSVVLESVDETQTLHQTYITHHPKSF